METAESGEKRLAVTLSDDQPGHVITADGTPVLLLKFASPGARALRLHISELHLPEGAALYAYSVDAGGSVRKVSGPYREAGSFWTDALPGDTAVVEVQWGDEIPGDLPFEITELAEAELTEEIRPAAAPETQGVAGSGIYRGRDVSYLVRDGLAVADGDIILGTPEDVARAGTGTGKSDGARNAVGITGSSYRWPGGVIPYVIASNVPTPSRVTDAIAHWNTKLSGVIRFVPRTTQANYVSVVRGSGCSSYIGMANIGAQQLWLGDACTTGSAIHELGHAVGLWHEQSRADRNSYIRILWANVSAGAELNFNQNITDGDDIGRYDHASIMHYGTHTFSSNGKPTIETIPAGIAIGQRTALSSGDIAAVRQLYGATTLAVSTVSVTFNTNPTGLQIKVDGTLYTAPRSFTWTAGSAHTVEAIEPAASSGKKYVFAGWSDRGARAHTLTASSTVTSYTATYSTRYLVSQSPYPGSAGTASVSPASADRYYPASSAVALTAQPAAGYCFSAWRDLVSGSPSSTSVTVTRAYSPRADFIAGSITLGSVSRTFPISGGTFGLSVSATNGCRWIAKSSAAWITITSGKTGTGPLTVTYSVAPNTSGKIRSGSIVVEGKVHTIWQY